MNASNHGGVLSAAQSRDVRTSVDKVLRLAAELREGGNHQDADAMLGAALESVLKRNAELELRLLAERRRAAGRKSERLTADQLALLAEVNPSKQDEKAKQQEERERGALDEEIKAAKEELKALRRKGKPKRGQGLKLGDAVRKTTTRVEPDEAVTTCPTCDGPRSVIGTDSSGVLHFEPARFWFETIESDRYACPRCKDGVHSAPMPDKPIPRSVASAATLAQVVVSKYGDHCPLTRQQRIYEREGVRIPVSTLCDWVAAVAVMLVPLVDALRAQVLNAFMVHVDATGLPVLDPSTPEHIHRGQMWGYGDGKRTVVFEYTPTGHADQAECDGVWQVLAGREGHVTADGAAVFNGVFDGRVAKAIEVGCHAHARRKLEALKDTDPRVAYPLQQYAQLFRIEELADLRGLDAEERLTLRKERSAPIFERLRRWMVHTHAAEVPNTAMFRATGYFLNQEKALARFLTDGRIKLTNNWMERELRAVAQGRDNYRFAGSDAAAGRAATILSVVRTAMLHGLDPLAYLTDVLQKLAEDWPNSRLAELLPGGWKKPQ